MKTNWKQKLSSRKFWALLAALAVSTVAAFGGSPELSQTITGVITAAGACVAYILAEGAVDKARGNGGEQE